MFLLLFLISYNIVDIEVETKWTDSQLILEASGLKVGNEFRSDDITNAINNLSRLRLFNFIAIDTSIVGDGIFFKIAVEEAPFLTKAPKFEGNEKIKNKVLKDRIDLRIGQVITDKLIFESKNKILELYKEKSFYYTTVQDSSTIDSMNKIELIFIIKEGAEPRIGKIKIEGNTAFPDANITKLMQNKPKAFLRAGKLDEKKLKEDVEKIKSFYKEKGYLDIQVDDPIIEVKDNKFSITIHVTENQKYYVGDMSFTDGPVFCDYGAAPARSTDMVAAEPPPSPAVEAPEPDGKMREWTGTNGETLKAEFVIVMGDQAVFKTGKGTTKKIPLDQLSQGDLEYIDLERPLKLSIDFLKKSTQVP